jgi:hypothetical protein
MLQQSDLDTPFIAMSNMVLDPAVHSSYIIRALAALLIDHMGWKSELLNTPSWKPVWNQSCIRSAGIVVKSIECTPAWSASNIPLRDSI